MHRNMSPRVVVLGTRQPDEPAHVVEGGTAQGSIFDLRLEEDGDPVGLSTRLRLPCGGGQHHVITWTPWDGAPVPFERDGDRLRIRKPWERESDGVSEEGWIELDGRLGGDARPASGVIDAEVRWTRDGEEFAVCRLAGLGWRAGGF
jgi:hypothetical protein